MTINTDMNRLIQMFVEAEAYIDQMVAEIVASNPRANSLRFWKRRAQLVHSQLEIIRRQILNMTPDLIDKAYTAGFGAIPDTDNAAIKSAGSGINQRAVALLSAGMNDRLDASIQTVGRRVDDAFRKAGLRAASYHAIAGTNLVQAAKQMEDQLKRDGTRAFIDKAGRKWSLKAYTTMVIRTTTREAMTQGTRNGLVQTEHELIKVSHHTNSCKICLPFDGKTYCLPGASDEMLAKYPMVTELPPFHPNCEHSAGPATDEFDAIEAKLLAAYGAKA